MSYVYQIRWLYPVSVPLWLISHIRNNGHHSDLSPLNGLKGTITGYIKSDPYVPFCIEPLLPGQSGPRGLILAARSREHTAEARLGTESGFPNTHLYECAQYTVCC